MILQNVLSSLVSLFCLIAGGYVMRKRGIINAATTKGLSSLLVRAGMPLLMLHSLQQDYSPHRLYQLGVMSVGICVVIASGILPCLLICRMRRIPAGESGAWMLCAGMSNAVFMVKPIIVALWGDDALFPLSGIMFSFNLVTFTLGTKLIAMGGDKPRGRRGMAGILTNPAILSGFVGLLLFFFSIRLPQPLYVALESFTAITSPVAMIILGSLLAATDFPSLFRDPRVYVITFLRLVVSPVLTYLVFAPWLRDPVLLGVLLFVAAMPTATTVSALSEQYGNNSIFCSKVVFVSTLLCPITIGLITWIFY